MITFTTETRLDKRIASDVMDYAKQYVHDFGAIERHVWQFIRHNRGVPNKAKLNTELQHKFGITKRTGNSVIYDMLGRYKALVELKKVELSQLTDKISSLEEKIKKLAAEVDVLKTKAIRNELSDKQLEKYRNKKKSLYYKKQRLQKLKDRKAQLEKNIADGNYDLGFGGKKMFRAQYLLEENGYKSHEAWYNDYLKARDGNIFYLGSGDESFGNQMFHLEPLSDGTYGVQIRKDGRYAGGTKNTNYVYGICSFSYLDDELRKTLLSRCRPVSYRIKIRGRKVYLQAMFQLDAVSHPIVTNMCGGAIGLDFNDGHIELSETDSKGNLAAIKSYPLKFHGTGMKAVNEMRTVVSEIGKYALSKGKSIVKEDLKFVKKKARTQSAKGRHGKKYNRMIHTLDYKRFDDAMQCMCERNGIDLVMVNPAYTSKIAKQKYCDTRKLAIHNGAAYVIARRGQGFRDEYKKSA